MTSLTSTARRRLVAAALVGTALVLPLAALIGCGASGSASSGPNGSIGSGGTKGGFIPGSGGSSAGGVSSDAGSANPDASSLPPEQEVDSSFKVPVATGRYVWVANPTSGRVAYVDASTVSVKTAEAGNAPTYLAIVPGVADEVIVLNVLSHDATMMQAAPTGLASTMISGVAPLANAWAMSPDGHFALAWTDSKAALAAASHDTLEGFQDLTAIDLRSSPPLATTLAVGYRPESITFTPDGGQASLYSNAAETETLVVVDLTTVTYRLVRVHALVLSVVPGPDGQFAVVLHRQPSASSSPAGGAADAGTDGGPKTSDAGATAHSAAPVLAHAYRDLPLDRSRAGRNQ